MMHFTPPKHSASCESPHGYNSRIAADEYLKHHIGHVPIDWEAGRDLVHDNKHRDEYLKALREADRGDYARLLAFVGAQE